MSRKITFLTLFLWLMTVTFPVIAQQKADTTYTFRFVTQKDMFYVPWNGNDTELARLLECIENNKATILDGKLPLLVDGYCNSQSSEVKNLATAKIRANRVKSELITRAKIKEENFITRNHVTEGDFVTVRLTVPVKETAVTDAEAEARRKAEAERLETETTERSAPAKVCGLFWVNSITFARNAERSGGNITTAPAASNSTTQAASCIRIFVLLLNILNCAPAVIGFIVVEAVFKTAHLKYHLHVSRTDTCSTVGYNFIIFGKTCFFKHCGDFFIRF